MPAITKTHLLGLAAAAIAVALTASLFVLSQQSNPETDPAPTPTVTPAVTPSVGPASSGMAGQTGIKSATVEGKKIFPSEAIPNDFRICAVNVATQTETCAAAGGEPTYRLNVPAGSYQVYAVVPSFDPSYRAYYSRFVTCGLTAECTDHSPITITVGDGQIAGGIDVGDFYR